jgi:hypothetical protein
MQLTTIKQTKKGEYIKRTADTNIVYIRGDYNRTLKQYELIRADDVNLVLYRKGSTLVYIGFTY